MTAVSVFLSTPSARRATRPSKTQGLRSEISIHALREEGDLDGEGNLTDSGKFLSTPSARRATVWLRKTQGMGDISIHALREEGDSKNRDKISIFKQIIQHSARI